MSGILAGSRRVGIACVHDSWTWFASNLALQVFVQRCSRGTTEMKNYECAESVNRPTQFWIVTVTKPKWCRWVSLPFYRKFFAFKFCHFTNKTNTTLNSRKMWNKTKKIKNGAHTYNELNYRQNCRTADNDNDDDNGIQYSKQKKQTHQDRCTVYVWIALITLLGSASPNVCLRTNWRTKKKGFLHIVKPK